MVTNKQLMLLIESLSNEKSLEIEIVQKAVEKALGLATQKWLDDDSNIRVEINSKTGDQTTYKVWTVIEDGLQQIPKEKERADDDDFELFSENRHIYLSDAIKKDENIKVGDEIKEIITVDLGRIAAHKARNVILHEVRNAERARQKEIFEKRLGEILTGIVRKVTRESIIVELAPNAEAILSRKACLSNDIFKVGKPVKAVLESTREDTRGSQFVMSRISPLFLIELFKREVPEVGEGIIEIIKAARDPGVRAKVAVKTNDKRIDPVGACVGIRGSRVNAVSNEMAGEKIDIILWDNDPGVFAINAMSPASIESIVVNEKTHSMDIAVNKDNLSLAIGRNGQNVRLASELTGWTLNVMSLEDAEEKSDAESETYTNLFVEKLNVDEGIAKLLANEGFTTIEELAFASIDELMNIEEFDEDIAEALSDRAKEILIETAEQGVQPDPSLLNMDGMEAQIASILANNQIVTMEDLADLSVDDLLDIKDLNIGRDEAAKLIMVAREPWFKEEE